MSFLIKKKNDGTYACAQGETYTFDDKAAIKFETKREAERFGVFTNEEIVEL